jgi:hypothetical protein
MQATERVEMRSFRASAVSFLALQRDAFLSESL